MRRKQGNQPDYVVMQRNTCTAVWSRDEWREEIWRDTELMRHQYELASLPAAATAQSHNLSSHSIVRRDDGGFIASGYHSLLHAIDVARSLTEMSGVSATVEGGSPLVNDVFDLCRRAAVVRLDEHGIREFWAKVTATGIELRDHGDRRDFPLIREMS